MTVFETGNLTMQLASFAMQQNNLELLQASPAFQKASLALQESALSVQRAAVWVAAIVGAAKCIVAGHGLFVLHRDFNHYAEQHRKNMKAIEGRIKSQNDQHRETMAALENQNNAMMELIRRTSAPSAQGDG